MYDSAANFCTLKHTGSTTKMNTFMYSLGMQTTHFVLINLCALPPLFCNDYNNITQTIHW